MLVEPLLPVMIPFPLPGIGPGNGGLSVQKFIPPDAPSGSFTIQAFVLDPGSSVGFSNSNGVEIRID